MNTAANAAPDPSLERYHRSNLTGEYLVLDEDDDFQSDPNVFRRRLVNLVNKDANNVVTLPEYVDPRLSSRRHSPIIRAFITILGVNSTTWAQIIVSALIYWLTVIFAVGCVVLYTWIEFKKYRFKKRQNDSNFSPLLPAIRWLMTFMLAIPNITFRHQLKMLVQNPRTDTILRNLRGKRLWHYLLLFFCLEFLFLGFGASYWLVQNMEENDDSYIPRWLFWAFLAFHTGCILMLLFWNTAIGFVFVLACNYLKAELRAFEWDLKEDKVVCQFNFAMNNTDHWFPRKYYRDFLEYIRNVYEDEIDLDGLKIMTREDILARYFDLFIKTHMTARAFQKWLLINLLVIGISVVEFLFTYLIVENQRTSLSSLVWFVSPIIGFPLMTYHLLRVNWHAQQLVKHTFPLEERQGVIGRMNGQPPVFHIYNMRITPTTVVGFLILAVTAIIGRLWNQLTV